MDIKKKTIDLFINDLSSDEPTPGGGAVAAISGAMAASLVEMVCNLTIGKKGYENEEKGIKRLRGKVIEKRKRLLELADEDVEAFEKVMGAYRISKDNKDKNEIIQKALKYATEVPLETAKLSKEVQDMAKIVVKKGNKNAYSDAKCAIHLSKAAIFSALENVKINLKYIKDKAYIKRIKSQTNQFK
jgi:formiminotetrahydrofolate cyclodeaminase